MSLKYEYKYFEWTGARTIKKGIVTMPELTHYGYDGYSNYTKANKTLERELMKKAKAELGLTGARGQVFRYNEFIEAHFNKFNTVLFIYPVDS